MLNKYPPATSPKAFGKAIADQMMIPVDGSYRPTVNGKQREAWAGIKLKELKKEATA